MKFSAEEKRGIAARRSRKTIWIVLGVIAGLTLTALPLVMGGGL